MTDLALLKSIFAEKGVTRALLVDDAFDVTPLFDEDSLARAFALFEARDEIADAFVSIGGAAPANPAALGDQIGSGELEAALRLAALAEVPSPLRELAHAIFGDAVADKEAQLAPLKDLERLLKEIGVDAVPLGSSETVAANEKFPLIFLDYYLGPKGAPSVEKSRERVMEIVNHYGPDEKPIVVLMSSELAKEKTALDFRDKAELLGCQFKFVMKSQFKSDGLSFVSTLADLVEFIQQSRAIGGYVLAWKKALLTAVEEFRKDVLKLDLHDYFQIQAAAGPTASRRLGDHMTGLFDGYLLKLVEERPELRAATTAMNGVTFKNRPPVILSPSPIVSAMAHAVSFQPPPPDATDKGKFDLELGDVFLREVGTSKKRVMDVCAVISQACDLDHGKAGTVLMIRGSVNRRTSKRTAKAADNRPIIRTDIFQHDSENLIIDWDASDLETAPVEGFNTWIAKHGYQRVARLRPVQALALQQKFASHLSRVGLPDMPPPYRFPNIEAAVQRGGKAVRLFDPVPGRRQQACLIGDGTPDCVLMESCLDIIRGEAQKLDGQADVDAAQLKIALETFNSLENFRALRSSKLQEGKAIVGNILIWDRETAFVPSGDAQPKGTWLTIAFYPGQV